MSTITATVLPALAAVRVELNAVADGPVAITRTDRNGARLVRQLPGQVASSGRLAVVDYEAALEGDVRYDVDGAAPQVVTLAGALPVLSVPTRPAMRGESEGLTAYDETSTSGSIRHTILGASRGVTILRPMGPRAGSLTLRAASSDDAQTLRDVASAAEVVLLRQPTFAGMDLYATVSQVRLAPVDEPVSTLPWEVSLVFTEEPPPEGGLLGAAAWTIDDVLALGVTVAGVPLLFPTVYALSVGP